MNDSSNSESEDSQEQNSDSDLVISNPIKNIILRPSKFSKTSTMATITLSEIKNFTEMIPHYEGNIKVLSNFINTVDEVYNTLNTLALSPIQKTYLFGIIKTKLTHKAAELLSENKFNDWEELKLYLTTNFTDKTTAETILQEIMYCKFKSDSESTLKYILEKFTHYKSKILLTNYNSDQKNAITIEVQKLIVRHFISLLPTSIRGSFIVKNPSTLEQCELLLRNEFNFVNQNQNLSPLSKFPANNKSLPQKFPADYFPSQPIKFKQNFNKNNTPFAPRQNVKNVIQTRQRFNPQPMSIQTRQIPPQPMSTQTVRQNYNIESEEQTNEDEEEINDLEVDQNNDSFLEIETLTPENTI